MTRTKYLFLLILTGIFFINTPEIHQPIDLPDRELSEQVLQQIAADVDRAVYPIYSAAALRIQNKLNEQPVKVILDGNVIEIRETKLIDVNQTTVNTSHDLALFAPNSLTADQWDSVVAEYNPLITDTGKWAVSEGNRTGIDNAYVLAMWIKESSVGSAGVAIQTKSTGNIRCFGFSYCIDGFRAYRTWEEGITAHFNLLRCYGVENAAQDTACNGLWNGKQHKTIEEAIDTWAPPEDNNNTSAYKTFVVESVQAWRAANRIIQKTEQQVTKTLKDAFVPFGSPLNNPSAILTQGYGVGTHAPAEIWGGIDLAISVEGGETLYATHSGTVTAVPNSSPGGNCILIANEYYRTTYCHMASFVVKTGDYVERGHIIGTLGSTGNSSGPHVHYEVWKKIDGKEVNQNPLDYGAMEGL